MTKLLAQEYLRSGKTLEELKTDHGVKSHITNGKICLNYDQIEAREDDLLACQCRGLILRESGFDVVACPMFRFFNIEQGNAANIDINTAAFEEKMDGTCIIVYWDNIKNTWCVGTRGRAEADVNIDESGITFSQLVDTACSKMRESNCTINDLMNDIKDDSKSETKNHTFVFELTSPINKIVCQYNEIKLTLLAVRNNVTLQESNPCLWSAPKFGLKTPQLYKFQNINHLIQVIREWNPYEHEGIVVKDSNYNRVKVKNPAYLALNHMRDSLAHSLKGIIELILLGKEDDVVQMLPEFISRKINYLKPVVREVLVRTQADYDELNHIDNMKEFAIEAQKRLWPGALFALKRNKTTDLKTFSLGNQNDKSKIPLPAINTMLELCKIIDPKVANLDLELVT
jgi:hypothetical protein